MLCSGAHINECSILKLIMMSILLHHHGVVSRCWSFYVWCLAKRLGALSMDSVICNMERSEVGFAFMFGSTVWDNNMRVSVVK